MPVNIARLAWILGCCRLGRDYHRVILLEGVDTRNWPLVSASASTTKLFSSRLLTCRRNEGCGRDYLRTDTRLTWLASLLSDRSRNRASSSLPSLLVTRRRSGANTEYAYFPISPT